MGKRFCSMLAAVAVIVAAASSAHAGRLRLEPTVNYAFFMRWAGTFKLIRESESTQCAVTLEGTFHSSTFPKVRSVLIGYIDGATMEGCRGQSASFALETLPWHVKYESFGGTLPNIAELNIQITEMLIRYWTSFFTWCNATTSASQPLRLRVTRTEEGALSNVIMVPEPITCNVKDLTPERLGQGEMVRWREPERRFTLNLI